MSILGVVGLWCCVSSSFGAKVNRHVSMPVIYSQETRVGLNIQICTTVGLM